MGTDDEDIVLPKISKDQLLARHQEERADFIKRFERRRAAIPRKDRDGRNRLSEEQTEEENAMKKRHQEELDEIGVSDAGDNATDGTTSEVSSIANTLGQASLESNNAPNGLYRQEAGTKQKESKAARRRRLKAEAEAASEKRIADEKAGLGPSERELETAAIRAQLSPLGLRIHDILPDGHCMYAAIVHQLQSKVVQHGHIAADVASLRAATADEMLSKADEYMPFLESVEGDREQFEAYCDRMRNEAVWGGQVELRAMAQSLKCAIDVFAAGMPLLTMGEEFASHDETRLTVSFHRHYYDLGDHYNSVVPNTVQR